MQYKFTLTYIDPYSSVETDLILDPEEEPKGFADSFTSELKRDFNYHGVFFHLSADDLTLDFAGSPYDILVEQFDSFGYDAVVTLLIERRNDPDSAYETLYQAQADFNTYSIDRDFVKLSFDENNILVQINDSKEVKVDTTATESLTGDSIAGLTPDTILLKGRNITKKNSLKLLNSGSVDYDAIFTYGFVSAVAPSVSGAGVILLFSRGRDEINYRDGSTAFAEREDDDIGTNFNASRGSIKIAILGDFTTSNFNCSFGYDFRETGTMGGSYTISLVVSTKDLSDDSITYNYTTLLSINAGDPDTLGNVDVDLSVDPEVGKEKYISLAYDNSITGAGNIADSGVIEVSNFSLIGTVVTSVEQSNLEANTFFDIIDHNIAFITGQENTLVSDILNNSGDLEYLFETNGFKIRNFSNPQIGTFIDRIDTLKMALNLGWGYEETESDQAKIRVDSIDHFYQDVELISFNDIEGDSYTESIFDELNFNKINLEYSEYSDDEDEAGTDDDVHGEAQFVTPVLKSDGIYDLKSNHIASDLLIEITRRNQFAQRAKERTKFDDNLFVLDCIDSYPDGTVLAYSSDMDIVNNIEDGVTGSNYRFNLRFNMFNHSKTILSTCLGKALSEVIKTTQYQNAKNQDKGITYNLSSTYNTIGDTTLRAGATSPSYLDANNALSAFSQGLFDPIKITFKVAISLEQLNNIRDAHKNKSYTGNYGYITITNPLGEVKKGWLLSMKYKEVDKIATFELIKKA